MRKIFVFFIIFVSFIWAIEITISPDKRGKINISEKEKDAIQSFFYNKYRFRMSDKGAKELARENRLLANAYLKEYGLNDEEKAKIKIETELYLANQLVKTIQKKIHISDDILLSYYMDHKNDFQKNDKVTFVTFFFPSAKSAMDFYLKNKDKELKRIIVDKNVTKKEYVKSINELKPSLVRLMKEYKKGFLPPFIGKRVSVIYVKSYTKEKGYMPFEKVKDKIKSILYKKTFLQERDKILAKYKNNN